MQTVHTLALFPPGMCFENPTRSVQSLIQMEMRLINPVKPNSHNIVILIIRYTFFEKEQFIEYQI